MKLKLLYKISFGFGLFYLLGKILLIPAKIALFQSQSISYASLAQFGLPDILSLAVGPISGVLIGILITTLSLSLIRNKVPQNQFTNIGVSILSAITFVVAILFIIGVFIIVTTDSLQSLVNMKGQISRITYPALPTFFLASIIFLVVGYVKEKLNIPPKNYSHIIFPSLGLLIVILLDFFRIFY